VEPTVCEHSNQTVEPTVCEQSNQTVEPTVFRGTSDLPL
jgi:hypothetical protein